jgi:glycosyltransferase involved in cell wall biosynthesis
VTEARVLLLLGPSTGGIRAHVGALAEALEARGWSVATAGPAGVLDGIRALDHVVPVPAGASPVGLVRARRAMAVATAGADLVHAHGLKAGWVAAVSSSQAPLVVSVHNLVLAEVAGRATPVLRTLEAALVARAERTIAISDEVARRFTGARGAGRVRTVAPLGPIPVVRTEAAAVRARLGVPEGGRLVVTVARLHPQKGLHDLLAAADLLRRRVAGLRWAVVGAGPLQGDLEAEVRRLGLDDVVVLTGARPSAADELAAADVVAVTSRWESGPLVVLEALALGRPVVATAVGLVPDVVGTGDGRIVPVGDPAAMAAALSDVLAGGDPPGDRRPPEGMRGAGRYGPDDLVPPVEAVYREVLAAR